MTYHVLTQDTGQTPERRREEAEAIVAILVNVLGEDLLELREHEREFVSDMGERDECSPKQLLWLRDLKAKYAE